VAAGPVALALQGERPLDAQGCAAMSDDELWRGTATRLAAAIAAREVSCVEVMQAHLARIEAVNPVLNAIVTLDAELALREAAAADRSATDGAPGPALRGLPIAIKDLEDTADMRTTYGSPIYRDHVPTQDTLLVARLRRAGAIVIGKTNTPEFGAGSQTFNPVFGPTRNPYDPARTPGGSSGGAAAAVAAGMLPFADGSDLGASIRNPASFCNLVGLRTSPGRVPAVPSDDVWSPRGVRGPLARTAQDAALLLRAMAGPDPRAPLSIDEPPDDLVLGAGLDPRGVRIAWSANLGDLPVEAEVAAVLEQTRAALEAMGCAVEEVEPDLTGADEAFETLRAVAYAQAFGELMETHPGGLKDTIVWNARVGLSLTGADVGRALVLQTETFERMRALLERYDALALPVSQVAPFPVEQEWVREIAGVEMGSYLEWMRSCSRITMTAHPAISVPAGFTPGGLPVGLQLVGRHRGELALLRLAAAIEDATGVGRRAPEL
jgi:amidase